MADASALILAYKSGVGALRLFHRLEAVGQMALTNVQARDPIICTTTRGSS